jgi:hypothetical protein
MMIRQMFIEFLRYRGFPAFGLGMGLVLPAAYFVAHNPGEAAASVVGGCCVAAAAVGTYLGFYIQPYLAAPLSPLVPGFRRAHIALVLSLNAVTVLLITMTATWGGGPWTTASRVTVFAILWCFGSIWLGLSYIGRASTLVGSVQELWMIFIPWFPVWQLMPTRFARPLLAAITYDAPISNAMGSLLVGSALTIFLGSTVLTNRRSRRFRAPLDNWGARETSSPLLRRLFWQPTFGALDALRHPAPGDFFSQVRLLGISRQLVPFGLVAGTWLFFLVCLAFGQYTFRRLNLEVADTSVLWMFYFCLTPFVSAGLPGSQASNLRLLAALPLARRDLAIKVHAAALIVALKVWLTFAAAAFIGALLPSGFGLTAFPSAGFLITSFTTQLAIFGVLALAYSVRTGPAAQVMAAVPLVVTLAAMAWTVPGWMFPFASTLFALGLLWASHHVFCHSEIH